MTNSTPLDPSAQATSVTPRVSLFANVKSPKPVDELPLHEALVRIRAKHVTSSFTSVRTEADRVGPT
jgi:hypothetical protein